MPAERGGALVGAPLVIVGVGPDGGENLPAALAELVDVVVEDPGPVVAAITAAPLAAVALVQVLRASLALPVPSALAVESAAYSMLQAGPEFAGWLATAERSPAAPDPASPVRLERENGTLRITLHRPHRHNAVSAALREELFSALLVGASDPGIRRVVLDGEGPSFCSGGDLAEFGTLPDPATAHLIRLARSPARLLATIARKLEVRLHGACIGAGIEMAAFAGRVVAAPDTRISLPELGLGLIPGAGGTVSLPRRIGRLRTAQLALTGTPIDAATAQRWGLVDTIEE